MKIKLTIEQADNGMIVRTDENVVVIECWEFNRLRA